MSSISGALIHLEFYGSQTAAVNVRPALADVSWVDVLLTNHFTDWL